MTSAIGTIAPSITCGGTALDNKWIDELVQLRVERALGLVGRTTMRFTDTGFELSKGDTFSLGTSISIGIPNGSGLFTGTVTGISLEQHPGSAPELVVIADDAGYKLARTSTVTTYLASTYTDVITKIATRNTLGSPQITAPATQQTFDYLMQAGNDLEFLNAVTGRLGVAWWFDQTNVLYVKPLSTGTPAVTLTLGDDLDEFAVRASALRPTTVNVNGWDPASQADITGTKADAGGAGAGGGAAGAVTAVEGAAGAATGGSLPTLVAKYATPAGNASNKLPSATASVSDLPPLTAAEATTLAGALYTDVTSAAVVARGTCEVNGNVALGSTIGIADAGPASGNYLVTEVEHVFDRQGFNTRFVSGPQRPAGLVDTLGIPAPDPGFLNPGLVVAVVSNITDDTKAGRVKVRYTGLGQESPWARVVAIGGGNARGALFQPEVNDEVLVAFENGDTRRPVVIGGLYSAKNAMPVGTGAVVADGKVSYRRITSRKNHVIELSDGTSDATKHIQLLVNVAPDPPAAGTSGTTAAKGKAGGSGSGVLAAPPAAPPTAPGGASPAGGAGGAAAEGPPPHKLRLGADRFDILLGTGKAATIQVGTAKFDVSTSGDVTIQGNNVTIKATQALSLEAATTATVKGTQKATLQGSQIAVQADATGSIQAKTALTIKGKPVQIN